jgi:hypothetical protein
MHPFLTKRIEIPWLTAIIIASSLLSGIAYLLQGRGGLVFGVLCEEIAWFFGPLLCGFLFCLLLAEIFWKRGGHPWSLAFGALFGFGTFYIWFYAVSHR